MKRYRLQAPPRFTTTTTDRDMTIANNAAVEVVSDAAGRMRLLVPWVRSNSRRAVAVEDVVDKQAGVRAVHAYPHTGSVVVWYSPKRCDRSTIMDAI